MKKFVGILAIFVLTLAVISPVAATELFEKDLKYGTVNNTEVKRLQEYLKEKNLYTGPISGNYYGLTRSAIMRLQKSYGLKQTGKFDSVIRTRLNKTLALKIELEQKTKELEEIQSIEYSKPLELVTLYYNNIPSIITSDMVEMALNSGYTRFPTSPTSPIVYNDNQPQNIVQPETTNPIQHTNIENVQPQNTQPIQNTQTNSSTTQTSNQQSTQNTSTTTIINPTTINWTVVGIGNFSLSPWNNDRIKPINWMGHGDTYPYHYFVNCNPNDPDNSWKTENVIDSTLGRGSVITGNDYDKSTGKPPVTIGFYNINGTDLNQYNIGPFIKSVTIQNIGTANLNTSGLVATYESIINNRKLSFTIQPNFIDSKNVSFTVPTTSVNTFYDGTIESAPTNGLLELYFKIDPTKMTKGETLKFKVTGGELTNSDPTKNYVLELPKYQSIISDQTLIKCDVRN